MTIRTSLSFSCLTLVYVQLSFFGVSYCFCYRWKWYIGYLLTATIVKVMFYNRSVKCHWKLYLNSMILSYHDTFQQKFLSILSILFNSIQRVISSTYESCYSLQCDRSFCKISYFCSDHRILTSGLIHNIRRKDMPVSSQEYDMCPIRLNFWCCNFMTFSFLIPRSSVYSPFRMNLQVNDKGNVIFFIQKTVFYY